MPKYLYLLRHGESAPKQLHQNDQERELTSSGIKESMNIGQFLLKSGVVFDTIISSSANRCKSTTQVVSDAMRADADKIIYEDELYEASVRTFLDLILKLDDHINVIMCVGHNPTISYLGEFLTNANIGEMATGGLTIIKFNHQAWKEISKGTGDLVNYIHPSGLQQ